MIKVESHSNKAALSYLILSFLGYSSFSVAGYDVVERDNLNVEVGARLVLQASNIETIRSDDTRRESETEVRRFRPYIRLKTGDWRAKVSYEASDYNIRTLKDAYIEYRGTESLRVKLGNDKVPFSRERMTSSSSQQLPERSLAGENNWGAPGNQPGLHLQYLPADAWNFSLSVVQADLYSDGYSEIRFVSPWERTRISSEALNSGTMVAGRVDFHLGRGAAYKQGDFKRNFGATFSGAAFSWQADDDTPTLLDHYADASGFEVSAGFRGHGVSLDIEYHVVEAGINADKLDQEIKDFLLSNSENQTPSLTANLLANNDAGLTVLHVDTGYMLIDDRLELVASYQRLSSDAENRTSSFPSANTWQDSWTVGEVGVNYFFDKHRHKIQLSYRDEDSIQGRNRHSKGAYLQWQYDY